MMLVDTGPIVALLVAADRHHNLCVDALARSREPLATTWPVIVEAMHLLGDHPNGLDALWEWLGDGLIDVIPVEKADYSKLRDLMRKYRDQPMDLADATLVHLALKHRVDRIFTTDRRDFTVFARGARGRFSIFPA